MTAPSDDALVTELAQARKIAANWEADARCWKACWEAACADIGAATARADALHKALRQIADRGTHHDLMPTMFFNGDDKAMYAAMCEYLRSADNTVRDIAHAALAEQEEK